jgi:hypothetical protein
MLTTIETINAAHAWRLAGNDTDRSSALRPGSQSRWRLRALDVARHRHRKVRGDIRHPKLGVPNAREAGLTLARSGVGLVTGRIKQLLKMPAMLIPGRTHAKLPGEKALKRLFHH